MRTLPQYHPWNTLKTWEAILLELKADIICFQETKTSRQAIDRTAALPGPFNSFYSFPVNKGGYSGVAVFTDSRTVVPLKAEEGLSGTLQPKPPLAPEERISSSYPYAHELELVPDEQGQVPSDLVALDAEGRALVLDFGLFVLINVYCPNEGSDARAPFKMNYHLLLQERVRKLIHEDRREVIVVGDINICAAPIDHCDGHLASKANDFWVHPARAWMRDWIGPDGPMVDVLRNTWPDRKGMYTCWNTKISARDSNYGTRIDYVLLTHGLLPWFRHGDIIPSVKGSDHCPVYVELHDEITLPSGYTLSLKEAIGQTDRDPPRLATRHWDEFSGKQKLLSTFFGKKSVTPLSMETKPALTRPVQSSAISTLHPSVISTESPEDGLPTPKEPLVLPETPQTSQSSASSSQPFEAVSQSAPNSYQPSTKRKSSENGASSSALPKQKRQKSGQTKLSAFFVKPTSSSHVQSGLDPDDDIVEVPYLAGQHDQLDADYRLACELSSSQENVLLQSQPSSSSSKSKSAWSQLMAPIKPPNCQVHGEPAKQFTVNKPGPNKGKTFFICSRPVGPGYDKGKTERLREEVDHQWRCDFFKWSSDVKRASLRSNQTSSGSSAK